MYVRSRGELGEMGQWIALATTILSAAGSAASSAQSGGLFSGKLHQSPWGFAYDDYPMKIWDAERAIAEAMGREIPPMWARNGGEAYQASMQAIVPRYVPGSEQKIAAYDRTLNEAGGPYETTYAKQLETLRVLMNKQTPPAPSAPLNYKPTQLPTAAKPAVTTPGMEYGFPDTIPVTPQQRLQAGMLPGFDMNSALPFIIGGGALMLILALTADKKGKR